MIKQKLPLVLFWLMTCTSFAGSQMNVHVVNPSARAALRMANSTGDIDCDVSRCGTVMEVSCHPETDGPVAYFDGESGAQLAVCGMLGCTGPGHVPINASQRTATITFFESCKAQVFSGWARSWWLAHYE